MRRLSQTVGEGSVIRRKGVLVSWSTVMATIRLSCWFGHCIGRRPSLLIGRLEGEEKPKNERAVLPQRWDTDSLDAVGDVDKWDATPVRVRIRFRTTFFGGLMALGMDDVVRIRVVKLQPEALLPKYAHTGKFGDLAADLYAVAATTLEAGATLPVATGVAMQFPSTHGALVEDRSGLAVRGITTLAGVIDPGYRGEIKVVMTNLSAAAVEIKAGDRIAQLRIVRRIEAAFEEVSELIEAPRGVKGFGSTGS